MLKLDIECEGKAQADACARWGASLAPGETIKIISHSMGGVYAMGFAQALLDHAKFLVSSGQEVDPGVLELIINTDMFQAGSLYGRLDGDVTMAHIYGYGTMKDHGFIAGFSWVDQYGATNDGIDNAGHSWENFVDAVIEWLENKREENKKNGNKQSGSN